jgi:hypothetical protein
VSETWTNNLELSFRNLRDARYQLGELERRREMLQEFRERFPKAPAYPARYSDRTLTGYRWRRAGHKAVSFDLTSETGLTLLDTLPADVRSVWIDFERRRLYLNLALALTDYERIRLRDFLDRLSRLRDAEHFRSPE